jgi:hypothetical protein
VSTYGGEATPNDFLIRKDDRHHQPPPVDRWGLPPQVVASWMGNQKTFLLLVSTYFLSWYFIYFDMKYKTAKTVFIL